MKMLLVCLLTAFSVTNSRAAIAAFERPSAIRPSTSRSRAVSRSSGASLRAGQQRRDHLGVEHGAAGGDPAYGVDERRDVGDPVLEQVADRPLAALEQLARVELLDVLRQHEDRQPGLAARAAIADRSPSSVNVGGSRTSTTATSVSSSRSAWSSETALSTAVDDLEVVRLEQPGQPVPEQRVVFGEDHPHRRPIQPRRRSAPCPSAPPEAIPAPYRICLGTEHPARYRGKRQRQGWKACGMSTVTTVGPPSGLDSASVPSKADSRRTTPRTPVPAAGSAPPRPSSPTSTCRRRSRARR